VGRDLDRGLAETVARRACCVVPVAVSVKSGCVILEEGGCVKRGVEVEVEGVGVGVGVRAMMKVGEGVGVGVVMKVGREEKWE